MPAVWFGTVVLWSVVEQKNHQGRSRQGRPTAGARASRRRANAVLAVRANKQNGIAGGRHHVR